MDLVVSLRVRREKTFLRGVEIAWLSGRAGSYVSLSPTCVALVSSSQQLWSMRASH